MYAAVSCNTAGSTPWHVQQATRPLSLAYAAESPVALAALLCDVWMSNSDSRRGLFEQYVLCIVQLDDMSRVHWKSAVFAVVTLFPDALCTNCRV